MNRIWRFLAFVCLLCPTMATAQSAQLSGVVKDKTGAVVPAAEITLKNTATAAMLQTRTSKVGFYIFPSVQPGRYDLSAEAAGFDKTLVKAIKVTTAANVSQDLILQIKQGAETVTVIQQAGLTTENGTVSTVVDQTQIENMPLNGKDLTTLFELSPGTILNAGGSPSAGGGFSVDGQRPTANYLTIDGASGEAYVPTLIGQNQTGAGIATSASGGTNGSLPIDAIEEYRMNTSTYTAENGRTPGGQIQIRTRGGTNQFHGTLFENFRNQVLDDTDWFVKYDGLQQTPLRMNDFGGTFGGPIIKNKLFFFLANDNLVLDQPNEVSEQDVPDSSLVQQAYSTYKDFLAVFPAGNGGPDPSEPGFDFYSASYPNLIRDHTTSTRLDAQLPNAIHAFFRANIAPSKSYLSGIIGEGSQVNIYTYTEGLTVPLGARVLNDITVNQTRTNTKFLTFTTSTGGNNPNAITTNLPSGVNSSTDYFQFELNSYDFGAYPYATVGPQALNSLSQWNIVDTLSIQLGKHALRFGEDFLKRQTKLRTYSNVYEVNVNLEATPPYTDLDTGVVDSLYYVHTNSNPVVSLANTSLFINDDWKVSKNLTVNGGVRWEYNPPPSVGPLGTLALQGTSLAPATIQASISNRPLYKAELENFAPRLGFALSLIKSQEFGTSIRGGVGTYFDTGQAATASGVSIAGYPYRSTENYTNPIPYSSVTWTGLAATANQTSLPESALYLINPSLMSPRTYEWSMTLEQTIGQDTKLSASYVGNDGEQLIGQQRYYNAENAGEYPVNHDLVSSNGSLYILTNQSHSNYQALQVQLTSRIGKRLSALASYTWGHAEDNGSTDFSSVGATAINPISNSSNDIRHLFGATLHYAPNGISGGKIVRALTGGWALDTVGRLQSASPFTVTVNNPNPTSCTATADVVTGQAIVLHEHIDSFGKVVPGNKLLNWGAFTSPPTGTGGDLLQQGDSPTNGYRLFGLKQWDLGASRSWKLWDGLSVMFRIDAYNVINTPNFGALNSAWSRGGASTFGRAQNTYASTYGATPSSNGTGGQQLSVFENGGPREVQLSMKLKF